jgi:hypothetical protein
MGEGPDEPRRGVEEYDLLEEFLELTDEKAISSSEGSPAKMFHDMSARYGEDVNVVRVELRRCSPPLSGKNTLDRFIPSKEHSLVGFIPKFGTPKEGEEFTLYYHVHNGVPNFGAIATHELVKEVVYGTNCVFFTTSEGTFKLEILDRGN